MYLFARESPSCARSSHSHICPIPTLNELLYKAEGAMVDGELKHQWSGKFQEFRRHEIAYNNVVAWVSEATGYVDHAVGH